MTGYWTLLKLDARLAARHKLIHVVIAIAVIFGALIRFVFPAELDHGAGALGLAELGGPAPTILDPGAQKPPFDLMFIPILFAVDLSVLGFMFGAVMVLQDKDQGTIRFFRVGPGTSLQYLASKLTINLGLALVNLLILVGIAAPAALAEPLLIPLVILTCAGMTLVGMGLAVFFRSLAQFFFPLAAIGLLGATPMYLVFAPGAALAWTRWVPTYHVLFGAEAIMFAGDPEVVATAFLFIATFTILAAGFCAVAIHNRLMREAP